MTGTKETVSARPSSGITDYTTKPVSNARESRGRIFFSPKKSDRGNRTVLSALAAVFSLAAVFLLLLYRMILTPPAAQPDTGETARLRPVFASVGDSGANILTAEEQLLKLGYDTGAADGIFTPDTAAAIRSFEGDCGLEEDGVLTAALTALLRQRTEQYAASGAKMPTSAQISEALKKNGCDPAAYGYRGALLLFQRTHRLRGTGEAGYATLCALRLAGIGGISASDAAEAESAKRDFEFSVLARYLYGSAKDDPSLADLHTLTGIACILYNRRNAPAFPNAMTVLCRGKITAADGSDSLYALCLRAAEDGFSAVTRGHDFTCGALFYLPVTADAQEVYRMNSEHQYIKTEGKLRCYR